MVGYSQNKVVLDRALDGTQVRGIRSAFRARRAQRQALRSRRLAVTTSASASSSGGLAEEDGTQQGGGLDDQNLTVPTTCMAQLSGSGGATMQKSKLNLTQEVRISQPKTDDAGGGGDIGNRIFNGGGGDGDDSDDDEYQDDFGDDDEEDAKVGLFDVERARALRQGDHGVHSERVVQDRGEPSRGAQDGRGDVRDLVRPARQVPVDGLPPQAHPGGDQGAAHRARETLCGEDDGRPSVLVQDGPGAVPHHHRIRAVRAQDQGQERFRKGRRGGRQDDGALRRDAAS